MTSDDHSTPLAVGHGPGTRGASIPGGEACLARLEQSRIRYLSLEEKRGVNTPVGVSILGGVRWHSYGEAPMVGDCRLAVALAEVGPELVRLGVTEAHFSGAYSYRMSRVGRLSLHAYGLAVDVHGFTIQGRTWAVDKDFGRGLSTTNCSDLPLVNQVACAFRRTGLFSELLTPDDNADHHDHLHLGIAPLDHPHWIKKLPTPERRIAKQGGLPLPRAPRPPESHASGRKAERDGASNHDRGRIAAGPSAEDLWETAPAEPEEATREATKPKSRSAQPEPQVRVTEKSSSKKRAAETQPKKADLVEAETTASPTDSAPKKRASHKSASSRKRSRHASSPSPEVNSAKG